MNQTWQKFFVEKEGQNDYHDENRYIIGIIAAKNKNIGLVEIVSNLNMVSAKVYKESGVCSTQKTKKPKYQPY